MLVFEERGKLKYPEKNLLEQGENQQKTQPTYDTRSGNQTWVTLVGGEHSHQMTNKQTNKQYPNQDTITNEQCMNSGFHNTKKHLALRDYCNYCVFFVSSH